jgi:hypothetical protein
MFWQLLIVFVGTLFISSLLGIWISNAEDKHMLKEKKKIHIYYVNKIKNLDYKVFEQEDSDYPNVIVIRSCNRWKKHWLDKANILDESLRNEVLATCIWSDNNCATKLENNGWTILMGEENVN